MGWGRVCLEKVDKRIQRRGSERSCGDTIQLSVHDGSALTLVFPFISVWSRGDGWGGGGGGGGGQIATESMSGEGKVQKKEQIVFGPLPLRQMESGPAG